MKILNSIFSVFFPPIVDIRRQIFKFEDAFDNFNKPFTLTPLPENAPPDIPRICGISKNQHSQLNITSQNIQIITSYDDNYSGNIGLCFDYINNKIKQAYTGLDTTIGNNILFSGLTMQVVLEDEANPPQHIADVFSSVKSSLALKDISSRLTYELNKKYYINLTIENARNYSGIQKGLSLAGLKEVSQAIMITVDFNDRLAFNIDDTYRSTFAEMQEISRKSRTLIENSINDLVEKGEFEYHEY